MFYFAGDIAKKIMPHLKKKDSNVIEHNSGLGLISYHLIKMGLPKIFIYESTNKKNIFLNKLMREYPSKIKILPISSLQEFCSSQPNFLHEMDHSKKGLHS